MIRPAAAALLLTAAATAAAATPAGATRSCGAIGDDSAPQRIVAAGVSCRAARSLAKAHWLQSGRFDPCALRHGCTVRGWRCTPSRDGAHVVVVRCRRDGDRVRFRYRV